MNEEINEDNCVFNKFELELLDILSTTILTHCTKNISEKETPELCHFIKTFFQRIHKLNDLAKEKKDAN